MISEQLVIGTNNLNNALPVFQYNIGPGNKSQNFPACIILNPNVIAAIGIYMRCLSVQCILVTCLVYCN